ncbi:MAG: CHAT domain-containing protein [Caldilinea sp. CFX5]|nr:CHAT domain-containing protein [Caldilinea sp. CFX5]
MKIQCNDQTTPSQPPPAWGRSSHDSLPNLGSGSPIGAREGLVVTIQLRHSSLPVGLALFGLVLLWLLWIPYTARANHALPMVAQATPAASSFVVENDSSLPSVQSLLLPVSLNDERLNVLREAIAHLGEGDRLAARGRLEAARSAWLKAAAGYRAGNDQLGRADAYLRLGNSYLPSPLTCLMNALLEPQNHSAQDCKFRLSVADLYLLATLDEQKLRLAASYYLEALFAATEIYETLIQRELSYDPAVLEQAEQRYKEGLVYYQQANCRAAAPLWIEAKRLYHSQEFGSGEVRVLVLQALCQLEQQAFADALTTLFEALSIAQNLPLGTPTTEKYLAAGRLYEQGDYSGALAGYEEVFAIYQENKDQEGLAQTSHELGNVYAQLGDYATAKAWYEQALPLFLTTRNEYSRGNTAAVYHNLGNLAAIAGHYDEAYAQFAQAIQIWQALGDPVHEVVSLSGLGLALRGEGKYDEALTVLTKAWEQQQQLPPNLLTEGDLRNNIGFVYHSQGKYQPALDEFERTLQLRRQLPQPHRARKEAEIFNNIAAVYASLSRFDEALATYQQALTLLPAGTPPGVTASVRANMAAVLIEQGNYQAGIATYLEVLPHFGDEQQTATRAAILQNLGAAYLRLGNLAAGEEYLQQALALFTTLDDQPSIAALNNNVGLLYAQAGYLATAQTYLQAAFTSWQTRQQQAAAAKALGNLSLIAAAEGDLATAIAQGEEALHLSASAGVLADQARIAVTLSLLHLKDGDIAKAQKKGEDARRLARQAGDPMAELGSALVLATAYLVKNEIAAADQEIQLAIVRLEALQGSISIAEFKTTFLGQLGGVYDLAVLIALANDQPEQAFVYAEQARARTFLDQLTQGHIDFWQGGQVDLRQQEQTVRQRMVSLQTSLATEKAKPLAQQRTDALQTWEDELTGARREHSRLLGELKATNPVYAAFTSAEVLSLTTVQQTAIDDQTTLILYFLPDVAFSTQPLAWVIDRDSRQHFTLAMSSTEVQTKVAFLHQLLQNKVAADDPILDTTLTALYRGLFAPLQATIHHANLVIIPHTTLHYLPFAALRDERRKRYLIEEYAITYAPSASALPLIQAQRNINQGRLVAFGNPDGTLPEATTEVQRIAQLYDVTPWLGAQATESQLLDQATQADIIHVAAHGVYDALNPLYTRIELAADAVNDGNLEVQEVYTLDLRGTNLVTLSACETALGQQSRGDELVGLTRAFFQAGAPTVMTTLWQVDDAATGALMVKFYEQLGAGETPAAALRTAQRAVLTEDKWRSPYYWAAFSLNGDYRGGEE